MVRGIGIIVGFVFAGVLLLSFIWGATAYFSAPAEPDVVENFHKEPKEVSFQSDGPFGTYNLEQLQRGFQVYKEVCSACHSLSHVAFRDLRDLGYSEAEVKAIADQWQIEVPTVNPDTGEATTRKATPADHFPSPYPNDVAARAANNNALPPDLSLIVKAREGGADYVYSILTGFQNPPANLPKDHLPPPGLHYNPYFATLNIAMPPPLTADGQVTFADGSPSDIHHMAKDVSAFLIWASEPKLEARHETGLWVVVFILIATILAYLSYRNVWAGRKH